MSACSSTSGLRDSIGDGGRRLGGCNCRRRLSLFASSSIKSIFCSLELYLYDESIPP